MNESIWRSCVVGILIGTPFTAPAWAQTGCDEVPESRRAQCERVMDCMTIDDADVRRACIAAAQRAVKVPTQTPLVEEQQAQPQPAADPVVVEEQSQRTPVERPQTPTVQAERLQPRERPQLEEQTVGTRRQTQATTPTAAQPQTVPLREPPESFSGEVTRIHQSILDRQVIALDNAYLFVSDQAAQGRFKVGQTIEASKATSRIRAGRTWRLVGPARRPVDAFRIRCERDDIGSDDRRRCERMLDR